jgi:hypothetical protein
MAKAQTSAARARKSGDRDPVSPAVAIEDETLSAEEERNLARASRDRAAGRFAPLSDALDVARRGGALRRPRARTRRGC